MNNRGLPIALIAEDNLSDRILLQEAFEASGFAVDVRFVASGQEFLDYLYHRPPWVVTDPPDLILLDLNMSREASRDLLLEVKGHPVLKRIPVLVWTDSRSEEDVADAYGWGANTYIPKPFPDEEIIRTIHVLCEFWFKICALPGFPGWKDEAAARLD